MRILLTGCAGFIGSHTLERLLSEGHDVVGVDNFDQFYSRSLKESNLSRCIEGDAESRGGELGSGSFELIEADLADVETYPKIQQLERRDCGKDSLFDAIIHLAAKAGVRPSILDPIGYYRSNVMGTQMLLDFAKNNRIPHFVFASSSSVYGENQNVPWSENDRLLRPISPYASTKLSCELMGHVYSHLFEMRVIGLRFFTVFGPRQRPDLAINKFTRMIEAERPIPVFGDGSTRRDYTFIDDIVEGVLASLSYEGSNFDVFNLGNDQTITLATMIGIIEDVVGKRAILDRQPEQPGDVPQTWADISHARAELDYSPVTSFKDGVARFYEWWSLQNGAGSDLQSES